MLDLKLLTDVCVNVLTYGLIVMKKMHIFNRVEDGKQPVIMVNVNDLSRLC